MSTIDLAGLVTWSPIGRIALSLYPSSAQGRQFVLFSAYYDESGVHQGSPCTVLAGLVANVETWARFEWAWAQVLRKNQITHLRAKHLFHRQGQHKGWTERQEETLWNDLLYVFQEHKGSITISKTVLVEEDYLRTYKADPLPKERLDSRYALCLRSCLGLFAAQHHAMNPLGSINFVLEHGHKNAGDALRVFNEFKQEQQWGAALGALSFGAKRGIPALQAADLIAYWAYVTERDILSGHLGPWEGSHIEDCLVSLEYTVARHLVTPLDLARLRQNFLAKRKKRRALRDVSLRVKTSEFFYDERYAGFPIEFEVSAEEVAELPVRIAGLTHQRGRRARSL